MSYRCWTQSIFSYLNPELQDESCDLNHWALSNLPSKAWLDFLEHGADKHSKGRRFDSSRISCFTFRRQDSQSRVQTWNWTIQNIDWFYSSLTTYITLFTSVILSLRGMLRNFHLISFYHKWTLWAVLAAQLVEWSVITIRTSNPTWRSPAASKLCSFWLKFG